MSAPRVLVINQQIAEALKRLGLNRPDVLRALGEAVNRLPPATGQAKDEPSPRAKRTGERA